MVRVSHLEVDLTEQRARWLDKAMDVTPHELRLLAALGEEPGRVLTFEQLNQRVWGTTFFGCRETIHSAVKRLRKKLAGAGTDVVVESVRSVGFRLVTLAHQPSSLR
jgi:DNA-binding response OmpR family regulator